MNTEERRKLERFDLNIPAILEIGHTVGVGYPNANFEIIKWKITNGVPLLITVLALSADITWTLTVLLEKPMEANLQGLEPEYVAHPKKAKFFQSLQQKLEKFSTCIIIY